MKPESAAISLSAFFAGTSMWKPSTLLWRILSVAMPVWLAIARLERGDGAAAFAAGRAKRVERGVIAFGDIAALRGVDRRRGHQGAGEQVDQRAMAGERRQQLGEQGRRLGRAREAVVEAPRLVEAVAELAEVARAAAAGDQPAERAADVGQGAQLPAQPVAQAGIALEQSDEVEPRLDPRRGRATARRDRRRAGARRRR